MSNELNMEAERAAFEAWYGENYTSYMPRMLDGEYKGEYANNDTQSLWSAWLAGRRTVDTSVDTTAPVSAPIVEELPPMDQNRLVELWDSTEDGGLIGRQLRFAEAIRRDAIATYAERIRQLERELKHAKLQELVDIAQECDMGYGKPAERKTASIGDDPKFQELLEEYDDAASHTAILHSLNALITYIDNFKIAKFPLD
jgi:hypothetical protein